MSKSWLIRKCNQRLYCTNKQIWNQAATYIYIYDSLLMLRQDFSANISLIVVGRRWKESNLGKIGMYVQIYLFLFLMLNRSTTRLSQLRWILFSTLKLIPTIGKKKTVRQGRRGVREHRMRTQWASIQFFRDASRACPLKVNRTHDSGFVWKHTLLLFFVVWSQFETNHQNFDTTGVFNQSPRYSQT